MKDLALWKFIIEQLQLDKRVMFITVVDYTKGSPGKTGFKLAFTIDKAFVGTIGGGVMEHSVMEEYSARLLKPEKICELRFLVHSTQATRGEPSGLNCAGSQTLCALSLDECDIESMNSILSSLQSNISSSILLSENGLTYQQKKNSVHSTFYHSGALEWNYEENIGPEYTVYIIGGGHVGNALSRILATLDVHVVVYDERKDLNLLAENTFAHKKINAPYAELATHIVDPQKSFAAIVTSNTEADTIALQQLIPLHLPYIGVMGTKAKIARIKKSLTEREQIEFESQHIHSPIGIQIGSRTVEEIAISIAAQIIAIKNSAIS
jgi:xanthine dehydrogenase accessory factor